MGGSNGGAAGGAVRLGDHARELRQIGLRRAFPNDHFLDARDQRRGVGSKLDASLDSKQTLCHVVGALENDVDQGRIDRHLGVARQVEQGFHFVREPLDRGEVQKSSQPFDGVESAKNRVDGLRV